MFEFTFEMNDRDDEILVEGFDGMNNKIELFLQNVRKEPWFIQGNRTEGVITWFGGDSVNLTWKSIDLDEDLFTTEQDHEVEVGVNHHTWSEVFGETEIN